MNETVREWMDKAEADYHVAAREVRVVKDRSDDAVCFHAQQCIEKLVKAALIQRNVIPPRIHDLVELSRLLGRACEGWDYPVEELRFLSLAAVTFRYPGSRASAEDAQGAFDICMRVRKRLLDLLRV